MSDGSLVFYLGTIVSDGVLITDGTIISDGVNHERRHHCQ
jgi:hypothetical protein